MTKIEKKNKISKITIPAKTEVVHTIRRKCPEKVEAELGSQNTGQMTTNNRIQTRSKKPKHNIKLMQPPVKLIMEKIYILWNIN
jgi:hypothetical protein